MSSLRVVSARFVDEQKFARDFFGCYDTRRIHAYPTDVPAIVKIVDIALAHWLILFIAKHSDIGKGYDGDEY